MIVGDSVARWLSLTGGERAPRFVASKMHGCGNAFLEKEGGCLLATSIWRFGGLEEPISKPSFGGLEVWRKKANSMRSLKSGNVV